MPVFKTNSIKNIDFTMVSATQNELRLQVLVVFYQNRWRLAIETRTGRMGTKVKQFAGSWTCVKHLIHGKENNMIIPFKCDGVRVTSCYGNRILWGKNEFHGGYDLVGVGSDEVVAVCDGTVAQSQIVASGKTAEWGNYVCIKTDNGQYHYYCHLKSRAVSKGQRVRKGEKIGIMGATGKVTGAHLHFEVRGSDGRTKISPESVLGIANRVGTYTKSTLENDLDMLVKKGYVKSPLYWKQKAAQVQYLDDLIHEFAEAVK